MKVIVVNDTTDWYHFGCTGTSLALKNEIEKLGHEVSTFSIVDCNKLNNLPVSVNDFFDKKGIERFMVSNSKLCDVIQANDIVIVNGEGTLHGIKRGPLSLLYIAYISKHVFFKNVQIINHSVYPNDSLSVEDDLTLRLYKKVYETIDFVAIREPLSASIMHGIGLNVNESFDCLPLYIKHHYKPRTSHKQKELILLSGTAAWFNLNIFTTNAQSENNLKEGLKQVIEVLKTKISEGHTVKFLYSDIKYPAKDDQEMITFFMDHMGKNFSVINAPSVDTWLGHIAGAGLLISGRYHHSIAAACLGTEFIALNSNTPKIMGLMKSMGYPKPLIYSDQNLGQKLYSVINNRSHIQVNSPDILENLCRKAQNNFASLKKLVPKL